MRARPPLECTIKRAVTSALLGWVAIVGASCPAHGSDPAIEGGVGIQEHLGAQLSIDRLHFADESGSDLPLSAFFRHDRPVILTMVYYDCPNLCTFVLNGLTDSLRSLDWTAGKRFDIVVVSINPDETPRLAASKKAAYVESYERGGGHVHSAAGWHFLTGEQSQIRELASQVGFHYRASSDAGRGGERARQFAHGSAIYVLTPGGKISRYLYGIEFRPRDVRLALLEASDGKIGTPLDRFLSFCYRYDPRSRHYEAAPNRAIAVSAGAGGAGTVLVFAGFLAVVRRRDKEKERA